MELLNKYQRKGRSKKNSLRKNYPSLKETSWCSWTISSMTSKKVRSTYRNLSSMCRLRFILKWNKKYTIINKKRNHGNSLSVSNSNRSGSKLDQKEKLSFVHQTTKMVWFVLDRINSLRYSATTIISSHTVYHVESGAPGRRKVYLHWSVSIRKFQKAEFWRKSLWDGKGNVCYPTKLTWKAFSC